MWRLFFNRYIAYLVLSAVVLAGAGYGLLTLRQQILGTQPYSQRLARVELETRPAWLRPEITDSVVASLQTVAANRSVFEPTLARDVYDKAVANPWIKSVQRVVKDADGTIHVRAEFRQAYALVSSEKAEQRVVVDAQGYVLPVPEQWIRPGALLTVVGVETAPPEPGKHWDAPDLADGLRLLGMIKDRSYAQEITAIDVRNFDKRISSYESELRLHAQVGQEEPTQILFGKFPAADGLDYVLSPQEKLDHLDAVVQALGGKLSGVRRVIDIRYDKPHVSLR